MVARVKLVLDPILKKLIVKVFLQFRATFCSPVAGIFELRHKYSCSSDRLGLGDEDVGSLIVIVAHQLHLTCEKIQDCRQPRRSEIFGIYIIGEDVDLRKDSLRNLQAFPLIVNVILCSALRWIFGVRPRERIGLHPTAVNFHPVFEIGLVAGCAIGLRLRFHPLMTVLLIAKFLAGHPRGNIFPVDFAGRTESIINVETCRCIGLLRKIADIKTVLERLVGNVLLGSGTGCGNEVNIRIVESAAGAPVVQKILCGTQRVLLFQG